MVNNEKEQVWRFTFGIGMKLAKYCQPIIGTYESARNKMFEMYGDEWAFQYSEEQWEEIRNRPDRCWEMEKDLEVVRA